MRSDKSKLRQSVKLVRSLGYFYSITTDSANVPMQISYTTDNKTDKLHTVLLQGIVRKSSRIIVNL